MNVSVPIMLGSLVDYDKEKLLIKLKQLDADELIICFMDYNRDLFSDFSESIKLLKENLEYFEKKNINTSVWICTTSFFEKPSYVHLMNVEGTEFGWKCPIGEEFASDYCAFIREIAKTGVRKIVLEDDFRMQLTGNPAACFCENHMKLYEERLMDEETREFVVNISEQIVKLILPHTFHI